MLATIHGVAMHAIATIHGVAMHASYNIQCKTQSRERSEESVAT